MNDSSYREIAKKLFNERFYKECILPDDKILKYLEVPEIEKIWSNCTAQKKYYTAVELPKKYYELTGKKEVLKLSETAADMAFNDLYTNKPIYQIPPWVVLNCSPKTLSAICSNALWCLGIGYPCSGKDYNTVMYEMFIRNHYARWSGGAIMSAAINNGYNWPKAERIRKETDKGLLTLLDVIRYRGLNVNEICPYYIIESVFKDLYTTLVENKWITYFFFPESIVELISGFTILELEKKEGYNIEKGIGEMIDHYSTPLIVPFKLAVKYYWSKFFDLYNVNNNLRRIVIWILKEIDRRRLVDRKILEEYYPQLKEMCKISKELGIKNENNETCKLILDYLIDLEKYEKALEIAEIINDERNKHWLLKKLKKSKS